MALERIVLVALVDRSGAVLLRNRDERSTTRPDRWSLPGGGAQPKESPEQAAVRIVAEQTGLTISPELRMAWRGRLPDPVAEVYLFATATTATVADIPSDPVPGAIRRRGDYFLEFVPGPDVLSGRSFTPASGYVLGDFLSSMHYRELAARIDPYEIA
ncbi:MAG TPA: RNA pyrophosphohydrolase [Micromonosporaceae bacterium]|nr:RNA pyrophosphohydrolase [Micromonosporaceae bacterium]